MTGPIPSSGNPLDVYEIEDPDTGYNLIATPAKYREVSYQAEKNGCGSGTFWMPFDDPAYGDFGINDVVAIRRDGTTVFPFVIERMDEKTLDVDGAVNQGVTFSGRGVGVFLEWVVIAPALGDEAKPIEEDVVWDWRSLRYWVDGYSDPWVAATEIMSVQDAEAGAWPHQPMADDFDLEAGAQMLWSSGGDDTYAPTGWCLFYRDIEITVPGRYGIEVLADDLGKFWVDGIEQLDIQATDGFVRASFKRLDLSVGTHRFCWAVFNFEDPDNPGDGLGPAALAWNLYKADAQDRPLDGGLHLVSDSDTFVLPYPDPWPGMTCGDMLDWCLVEGIVRGGIGWVTWPFWANDSHGDAFDRELGVTTKTGTTVLQFLDELVAARRISQWKMQNDGVTFDLWRPDYTNRPAPGGDTILLEPAPVDDPRTGQLVQLDRTIT